MLHFRRGLVVLGFGVTPMIAGCGGGPRSPAPTGSPESSAAGGAAVRSGVRRDIESARDCLRRAGVTVRGGYHDRRDDPNAPDGELMDSRGTFIAFYASRRRAEGLAAELEARARELGGTTTRHGRVTALYAKVPEAGGTGEPDDRVESCLGG